MKPPVEMPTVDPIQRAGGLKASQLGLFLHELGHNLGLHHGGRDDPVNCKPNYMSVMSYPYTTLAADPNRPLDFSRAALPDLDENALSEPAGIGGPPGRITGFGDSDGVLHGPYPADGPLDFNLNMTIDLTPVVADINNMKAHWKNDCTGVPEYGLLRGRDDWSNLDYNWRNGAGGAGGGSYETANEPDGESIVSASESFDADSDGTVNAFDNCPGASNPAQEDPDADSLGNPCDADDDGDALLDTVETNTGTYVGPNDTGTDPLSADTDADGFADGVEVTNGTDPTDADSFPPQPVPALSPLAMSLLGALLLGAGLLRSATRRRV